MADNKKKFLDEAGVTKISRLVKDMIEEHTEDDGIHVTSTDKANLSAAVAHAKQTHAPATAEKNIIVTVKKNGTALTPDSSRAVNVTVPTKVSELTNDSSYATTSSVSSSISSSVSSHNTNTSAHSDIRSLITTINTRLNAALDSDDTTLDQMSEIVAYIKSNKSLIDSVTTSKVNTSDIVDNLTTNVTTKVLAASQGVAIKKLIDALQVAVDGKAASSHTHDDRYYTESEINTKLAGYSTTSHSHGNYASTITVTGSGNAITGITQSGNTITATKGATFLTAHPTISKSTDSTSTANPAHAGTFTAVDSVTRDGNGHVTKINTKTVTLPSETKLSKGTNSTKTAALKHAGTFAVVTGTTVSNHVVTDTVTTFSLPTDYDFGSLD